MFFAALKIHAPEVKPGLCSVLFRGTRLRTQRTLVCSRGGGGVEFTDGRQARRGALFEDDHLLSRDGFVAKIRENPTFPIFLVSPQESLHHLELSHLILNLLLRQLVLPRL